MKYYRGMLALISTTFGVSLAHAYTPPAEMRSDRYRALHVYEYHELMFDIYKDHYVFWNDSEFNLKGFQMGVGKEILVNTTESRGIYGGSLIGGWGTVMIHVQAGGGVWGEFRIDAIIKDAPRREGELDIYGDHGGDNAIVLAGRDSNTYTGYTRVSGRGNRLALAKTDGAIAIRGRIEAQDQGGIEFRESDQLTSSVVLTLRRSGWVGFFNTADGGNITNKLERLVVDGHGVMKFDSENHRGNEKRSIYLDDIEFINGGFLDVLGWEYGADFLLIKKSSKHINDALKNIVFKGYDRSKIHLEDFNNEYWAIVAPEPATYGAALIGTLSTLVIWQRRRKGVAA